MKRLVLFVEGDGERAAVPKLVKRLLTEKQAWDAVQLDPVEPLIVGHSDGLLKDEGAEWTRFLKVALRTRRDVGGCLLILDGDARPRGGKEFCAKEAARQLAHYAQAIGAGVTFSVAVVFACQEYESWILAAVESLAGEKLPDGSLGIVRDAVAPEGDLEIAPRDAKGAMSRLMASGYKPTMHQAPLTELMDLECIRRRSMRSFRRLESAVEQLISAFREQRPIVSPITDPNAAISS